ncbi:MAG TPA: hypothetical protein VGH38_04520, partial [Bryobacteraceae bacterium]
MRSNSINKTLNTVVLTLAVLLLGTSVSLAQQQVNLTAGPTSLTLADGAIVPMWGYSCGLPVTGSTASCAKLNPKATGWSPVVITVPSGQQLQINLTNNLSFMPAVSGATPNNIPTSIVVVGQVGGGLGTKPTYVASPNHEDQQVTWPIANTGATNVPPAQGPRVQSFAQEVEATPSTVTQTPTTLMWNLLKPGTYLLESGTHPSIQVPMGLIGMLVVTQAPAVTATVPATETAVGTAYPGVSYDAEVPLEFSEIDPTQNATVDAAVKTQGFGETTPWTQLTANGAAVSGLTLTNAGSGYTVAPNVTIGGGGGSGATAVATLEAGGSISVALTNGGSGYTSIPTVLIDAAPGGGTSASGTAIVTLGGCGVAHTCYPPAVNYTPLYYLINGVAFSRANSGASLFNVSNYIAAPPATGSGQVLMRLVNAGLRMHVPSIVGSLTTPAGATTPQAARPGFSVVAE